MTFAPYLTCHNLSLSFGPTTLFSNLSFAVHPGERWGIVGPNGAGKSSLLKMIEGKVLPDVGTVSLRNQVRHAVIEQKFTVNEELTVEAILRSSIDEEYDSETQLEKAHLELETHIEKSSIENHLLENEAWLDRLSYLQELIGEKSKLSTRNIIDCALKLAGLNQIANKSFSQLSGGQQKRVQIVSTLLKNPQLVLLDEPTNHLDIQTVEWLEDFLLKIVEEGNGIFGFKSKNSVIEPFAYVIISHDRALLDTLVNKILEIENGEARQYEGNYETYMQQKLERVKADDKRQEKNANLLKRELAWLRTGAKARTTKQTARIERAHALDNAFNSKAKKIQQINKVSSLEFNAEISTEKINSEDNFVVAQGNLGNQDLIQFKDVTLKLPRNNFENFFIFKKLNLLVKPKMRIALLGPNGCGKSTLMNLIVEEMQPTDGKVMFHELTKISYFDQFRQNLDFSLSIKQTVSPEGDFVSLGNRSLHVVSYLEKFLFSRIDINRPVKDLSGGEQARLLLARLMLEKSNVLLLDEPTNDLDIPTLQVLERNLIDYDGALVFTSHDRYFVQRVATHLLTYGGIKVNTKEAWAEWMLMHDLDQALNYLEKTVDENIVLESQNKVDTNASSQVKNKSNEISDKKNSKKSKITFQEQKEYELLEVKIPEMETKVAQLNQALDESYAQGKSYEETKRLSEEIKNLEEQILQSNVRWEELFLKK